MGSIARNRHPDPSGRIHPLAHTDIKLSFPITKSKVMDDGSRVVWGKVTDGSLDRDGQIVDPDWAADKLMDWYHDLGAPVRNMHSGTYPPAGKGIDLEVTDDGCFVRAAIVEPTAIKLLDLGVYKDFSIGIAEAPLYPDPQAPGGRLGKKGDKDGWVNEVSLVDTGSNKNAHLTVVKRAKRSAPFVTGTVDDKLAQALIDQIVGASPDKTKETKSMSDTTTKAAGDDGAIPDGRVACGSCEGGKIKGELPCPKCKGKGHLSAKKAGKLAAAPKGDGDLDGDVSDALDDVSDAVDDAVGAQAADESADKGSGPANADPPAQDGIMKPKKPKAPDAGPAPVPKKAPKAKKADPPAADDDGDKGDAKLPPFLRKKKAKAAKAVEVPYLAMRAHDILCPCYSHKAVRKAYGDVAPEALDPDFFQRQVAERAMSKSATPGSVAEAAQALQAAVGLQGLAPKTFAELARAAHKTFLVANPGLPNLAPRLINPESFRRPFLPGATGETATTTEVPSPALKPTIAAGQFDRGPLTDNETRSSLVGGQSVAKGAGTAVKGRTFYTNAAASEHTTMMGDLHDWIAQTYPGCCPLANPEGGPSDSDGMMGRPAEMNAPLPPEGPVVDTKAGATITPVRDTARANKGAGAPLEPEQVEALVKRRVKRASKALRRETRTLKRQLKAMAASPDPRLDARRGHTFGQTSTTKSAATDPDRLAKAREARDALLSRDSTMANEGLDMLRGLNLSPREFARQVVGADA